MTIARVLRILQKRHSNTMLGTISRKWNHYKVLIATILSARCTDEVTERVAADLFKKYPTAAKLAQAKPSDVKKIIHSIGFYNNKTKSIIAAAQMIHKDFRNKVPDNFDDLLKIPGVGRKVAGCVMVYAHGKDAIPVDTHVHRISNRLGWVKTKTPDQTEQALMKITPKKYWKMLNDTLVTHGKTICTPLSPFCSRCPVKKYCKRVGVTKSR